jgi:hypothetical protein
MKQTMHSTGSKANQYRANHKSRESAIREPRQLFLLNVSGLLELVGGGPVGQVKVVQRAWVIRNTNQMSEQRQSCTRPERAKPVVIRASVPTSFRRSAQQLKRYGWQQFPAARLTPVRGVDEEVRRQRHARDRAGLVCRVRRVVTQAGRQAGKQEGANREPRLHTRDKATNVDERTDPCPGRSCCRAPRANRRAARSCAGRPDIDEDKRSWHIAG